MKLQNTIFTLFFVLIFLSTAYSQEFKFRRHEVDIVPNFSLQSSKVTLLPTLRYRFFFNPKWAVQADYTYYPHSYFPSKNDIGLSVNYYLSSQQQGAYFGFGGRHGGFEGLKLVGTMGYRIPIKERFFINAELGLQYSPQKNGNYFFMEPKVGIGFRF